MPDGRPPDSRILPRSLGRLAAALVAALVAVALLAVGWAGAAQASVAAQPSVAARAMVTAQASVTPPGAEVVSAPGDDVIGGISVDEVVAALGDDHVAVLAGSTTSESELAAVAKIGWDKGFKIYLVSLGRNLLEADAKALATQVLTQTGGTVLVMCPITGAVQSETMSTNEQQRALDAYLSQQGDVASAKAFIESATSPGFPWVLVLLVLLVVAVLVGLGWQVLQRRRKNEASAEALAELTKGLAERLGKVAPLMLSISPRVDLAGRPDLKDRFQQSSTEYTELLSTTSTPLPSRAAVNETGARIAALEKRLGDLDAALDELLPGIEPPAPAG